MEWLSYFSSKKSLASQKANFHNFKISVNFPYFDLDTSIKKLIFNNFSGYRKETPGFWCNRGRDDDRNINRNSCLRHLRSRRNFQRHRRQQETRSSGLPKVSFTSKHKINIFFKSNFLTSLIHCSFDMDPTVRVSTTSAILGTLCNTLSSYGCQQNYTRRYRSMKNLKEVKR